MPAANKLPGGKYKGENRGKGERRKRNVRGRRERGIVGIHTVVGVFNNTMTTTFLNIYLSFSTPYFLTFNIYSYNLCHGTRNVLLLGVGGEDYMFYI